MGRTPENRPKESWSTLMCVPQPGTNREDCCNYRLYDQPEIHRPRQSGVEVLPDPYKDVVHAVPVSDHDFFKDAAGQAVSWRIFSHHRRLCRTAESFGPAGLRKHQTSGGIAQCPCQIEMIGPGRRRWRSLKRDISS